MLKRLFDWASYKEPEASAPSAEQSAVALLYMLAKSDQEVANVEIDTIRSAALSLGLAPDEIDLTLTEAEQMAEQATSVYEFTQGMSEYMPYEWRVKLIELLWQVAYADERIDKYEEHLIRRVCDLLYVSHSEFIKRRNIVRDGN
jgi:uncharacterized tellurite resistance protein B-like protein